MGKKCFLAVPEEAALRWYSPALLLADIIRMSGRRPCRATNRLFAQRYGVSETTVRRGLRALADAGLLRIEMDESNTVRTLVPCVDMCGNFVAPPPPGLAGVGERKRMAPLPKSTGTYIRKEIYGNNTKKNAGTAPKGLPAHTRDTLPPEERSYTLQELIEMNLR